METALVETDQLELDIGLRPSQTQFLTELGQLPEAYRAWYGTLAPDKQMRIVDAIHRTRYGLWTAGAIICYGPSKCPFYNACPIPNRVNGFAVKEPDSNFPIGQFCVLEGQYFAQKIADYLVKLDVQPEDPVEMAIVHELALIDLYKNRINLTLSHGDAQGHGRDLMKTHNLVTGFSQEGEPIITEQYNLHPLVEHQDKLERRRERWLDKLLQTRRSKAEIAARLGRKVQTSDLLKSVQHIKEKLDRVKDADEEPLKIE